MFNVKADSSFEYFGGTEADLQWLRIAIVDGIWKDEAKFEKT
jgi:hypothetical protein